ncbi:MAG: ATP-binding protein, partial [Polyangiales bacterium]
ELLANVSHELRSPAHCIAGFVELLMHEKLAPAQRRYVELISDQCSSMLRQVEDLLSLAALEAGGVELMLAPLELPALIGSLLESVEPTAQARGITLSSELALSQPWVEGDVLRLKQVLQNLVDNALKFTESGSVLVAVRDDPTDPSHVVLFEVRDTGIGMQQFEVDALLAPFRQGDSGSNRRHGGVGLGLAIVERLVTAMGGKLEIESALGRGTVVRFRVPLAPATKTGTEVDPDQDQPLLGRALVVDDSAPSRELLVAMLALSGVEAIEAASAQQARALLAGRDVDVVFLDYQMPESDGAEAAAMLRRVLSLRDPSRRVPIYILTANVFAREQLREAAQSVDGVLTKPLSRAALTRLLRIVRSEPALPPSPTHTQIDRVVVDELLSVRGKDGSPLLHRLLPKVATDMAETLDALETAASELDGPAVTRHAHAAAGHAAIVGARACAHLARELEDKSREQPDDGLTLRELASLRNAWTSALGELQSVLSNALTDK